MQNALPDVVMYVTHEADELECNRRIRCGNFRRIEELLNRSLQVGSRVFVTGEDHLLISGAFSNAIGKVMISTAHRGGFPCLLTTIFLRIAEITSRARPVCAHFTYIGTIFRPQGIDWLGP